MSIVFSKNKEKRSRTSSNEANTSFVKNVTSRVSGLLPSTITKWFSSPSSSNANGSAPTADATDSSTEDEASETPVVTQPPAKRMRYSTPGKYNHYGPLEGNCSTSNIEITEIPYSPYSGTQFSQSNRNTITTPLRSPSEDHGISKDKIEKETPHNMYKPQHTVGSIGQSIANKRKSIFNTDNEEDSKKACAKTSSNTMRDPKQPSFKPSLLGSPFYPGRTMYGGAASSYINQANIKQQTVAVVNESKSNEDAAMSSSARRILDLLESYSSPLSDARRIPQYTRPKNNSFNTSTDRFTPYSNKSLSYKTQELHVPSIASILQLKKKSRLMDTTNAARQIIASHSSASNNYPSYPTATATATTQKGKEPEKEQPNKMTTKVKPRLTRANRGNQEEFEVATPVKLPTGVLQIDQNKLPKFSFDTPAMPKIPATATSTPKIILNTAYTNVAQYSSTSKHDTVTSSVFTFSNPVKVSSDTPQAESTPPKFTFDSPERRIELQIESKRDDSSVVVGIVKENEKLTPKSIDWQCSDCWVKNKSDASKCVCCGAKQPSKNTKCSVCKLADSQSQKDKCVNCEKMQVSQVASPLTVKPAEASQSTKWKCEDCWVANDDYAVKCACCGAARPNKSGATPITSTIAVTPNTKPETVTTKVGGDWKCDDCWISNRSSVEKCAACGGAKPGTKQNSTAAAPSTNTSFFGASDNTFKNLAKSQTSAKWECTSCLVRNDSDKDKCACCGAEKENKNKMPESKFNFGLSTSSSFKFGIDPKIQEATIAKKPETQSTLEPKLKEPSETNNNVLAETPTFTFALPTKKVNEKVNDISKTKSEEVPKMNFSFGIPKQVPTSTVVTNKPLESNKVLEEEKPQEVPLVDLNSPVQDKPKAMGKIFMSPLTQVTSDNKLPTIVNTATLPSVPAIETKKDLPSNSISLITPTTNAGEKPAFSFGVKPTSKMFDTPATTASSMNLFAAPSQTTTLPSTSAPALSLFKSEAIKTSSSIFQPPEATAKPALFQNTDATGTATTAPMFSFGNNASSTPATTAPSAEKPKFQFTFGSNATPKTEPPALFKSPFGATETNAKNTKSFSLSSGATLGSGNALPVGGSNGMSTANGITGNTLGTMPTGNQLIGNNLPGSLITGNTLTGGNSSSVSNTLGGPNGLSANPLSSGNALQSGNTAGGATGLFGNTVPKENVWSASNNAPTPNLFVSNPATNSLQKAPTFTFGSSTPFNAGNATSAFGNNATPPQNIFGMGNQNNNAQPSMFSNAVSSPPTGNLFGSPAQATNPAPQMGLFGTPNIGAAPSFGTSNTSITSFDAPSLTPAPAPAFNFGAPQATGIFGFGQQPQQAQLQQPQNNPPQAGIYSFGGAPAGGPQVQFSMGSGANTAVRRVRKAVRRNPQR